MMKNRTIWTSKLIKTDAVQRRICHDICVFIRLLATTFEISKKIMSRIVHEYPKYTSNVLKVRWMLSEYAHFVSCQEPAV